MQKLDEQMDLWVASTKIVSDAKNLPHYAKCKISQEGVCLKALGICLDELSKSVAAG